MKVVSCLTCGCLSHLVRRCNKKRRKKLKICYLIALLCKYPCASDVVVPTLDGELSQYLKLEEHNGQIWLMATTPEQSDNIVFIGEKDND